MGEITGEISFEGEKAKPAVIHMDQDPVCVSKHSAPVHVEDGDVHSNGTLPNFFIYVKEGAEKTAMRLTISRNPPAASFLGCRLLGM